MSEFRFTAIFWHQLRTFQADFKAWASTNRSRKQVAQRLDIMMTFGNLVALRNAVRESSRLAGKAGRGDLLDRGAGIAHQLNGLIEEAGEDAA